MEPKRKHPHEMSDHEPDIFPHKRRELERNARPKLAHHQYTVGWICAIHTEYAAAQALLDEEHVHPYDLPPTLNDGNHYTFGRIGPHNVVMAVLAEMGTAAAAAAGTNMQRSFPKIEIRLMVGIGGGAPTRSNDIRLGDVVVSTSHNGQSSVLKYDYGKDIQGQRFKHTSVLDQPPQRLRGAVVGLRARYLRDGHAIEETINGLLRSNPNLSSHFARPNPDSDKLYKSTFVHPRKSTETCVAICQHDPSNFVERSSRTGDKLVIHYGTIASADQVMKNAKTRDKLAAKDSVLCFEMEAGGLSNTFPCLVVRGICDYSDSHKNKEWQGYAAMTAAAYAKDLLYELTPLWSSSPVRTSTEFQHPKAAADRERPVDERRKQLLDSLSFDQIDARQMTIKKAHAKTCKWVLESSEYLDWLDHTKREDHRGFLWIKGKPGTGKSTLMKFVSENYRKTTRKGTLITFFFNARGEELEKSTIGMYRSLLFQLIEGLRQLQSVLDLPALMTINNRTREWTVEFLKELLEEVFRNLKDESVTCFIDALDECDEDQIRDMVSFFESVSETTTTMNISFQVCFSSRHYPHITISKAVSLILEGQEGHKDDIIKYVHSELRIGASKMAQQVRDELQEKASGVFMWVVLVVDILNKEHDRGDILQLRQRLRELPGDLDTLFRDILIRDSRRRDKLLLCIQWVLFAKTPLSPKQLYFAILSGTESHEALSDWDPEDITADVMKRSILNSSKGLAEVTKSKTPTVQFIHESVRDFLLKHGGLSQVWPEFSGNFQGHCHEQLKVCCLNYLAVATAMEVGKDLPEASPKKADELRESAEDMLPFIRYATQQVLYHSDQAEESGVSQVDFLQTFDLAGWTALNNLLEKHKVRRHNPNVSLLYILAEQNRANLIKVERSKLACFEIEAQRYGAPIFAALATGSFEAVHALLAALKEANPNSPALKQHTQQSTEPYKSSREFVFSARRGIFFSAVELGNETVAALVTERGKVDIDAAVKPQLRTPLSYAAEKGLSKIVQFLIESDRVETDRKDKDGMTPLAHAAKNGHDSVAKMLLETDQVDPENADGTGRTPLAHASINGHDSVVKMLLETGRVHPDNADASGRTPLAHASINGHDSVVKMLLETGRVHPDNADASGRTPLAHASINGHDSVVKMLLETGQVDPDKSDGFGRTPFSHACTYGHKSVVKRLLATGRIDINHQSEIGFTPLWYAVEGNHPAVVQLLLEADQVEADRKDNEGETPLSYAASHGHRSEICRLLLRSGKVDADSKDASGRTPLSQAAGAVAADNIKILLDSNQVEPDSKDDLGRTPLSYAASTYSDNLAEVSYTIELLLGTNRVKIDSKDNSGRTPLSHAAGKFKPDAVSALLKAGADPTLEDKSGRTPLSYATESEPIFKDEKQRRTRVIELLQGGMNIS
ncbi:hypothetical protein CkaCkLH20_09416 [Colletotrichum karsti]|uniref:Nucleoside phosphorylase domain-containing protein n=1 Tax=Colletotrichum karsti TaxID=1095194 RepID=A0A9P6LH75_9PEZI|nr:uncharacterized protein CkaCkLH20_09416 [Colletotrichum karsti]KAF9873253.1 hypothetical protein CkaCkLH20_09416 [Colletotrichum karsti]